MKENQFRLTLDDLRIESFVTSIDSEMNSRLAGGIAGHDATDSHPTHTELTDDEGHECETVIC
ncbi:MULTISPECIES: pinensin family lanthipeptide [Chitinophaga]|jgi:hypothetical protein|uniref:pinensin family lanthipeptide n=1 Tax=Chitinophaga TaxID=79328 RepID=UPI000D70EE3F|nr:MULTISPECIES: pinensin family lanthipeptide [Chitinophaga]MCF6407046.1 pinensin family lanthipeptide [Chitinophaga filiformis]PWV48829.1 hypothetical protein C7475_10673 [Chitinophaga sp. S165]